jgi:Fe-S cluster biogenesis protein NfuA
LPPDCETKQLLNLPGFQPGGFVMAAVLTGAALQEDRMRAQIEQALEKIRPALERDGGGIELIDVEEDGIVKVRLTGACGGCPMSQMTLKQGVERIVKQMVPEVKAVEAV